MVSFLGRPSCPYLIHECYVNVISRLGRLRHPCEESMKEWESMICRAKLGILIWKTYMEPWIIKEGSYKSESYIPSMVTV